MTPKATVLVIDGGGRGTVLVNKYLESPYVAKVLAIPGNDLMVSSQKKSVIIFPQIKTIDVKQIVSTAKQYNVDLVDVAQDDAVAVGVTDAFLKEGFKVFGPLRAAGRIEWDKAWARNFMRKFEIPSPSFKIYSLQEEGIKFIKSQKEAEWFIKAAGLAAGKGALYAKNNDEALEKIHQMKKFGKASEIFLIEECLHGEEFSSFAIVDGQDFILLGHAQDHKPVFNGNLGPNTGGMGCASPPMVITPKIGKQIESIFKKTVEGLAKIGRPYRGILYLGGMIVKEKKPARRSPALPAGRFSEGWVYVIEFNARWGDPEAQVIIPAIKNDLYKLVNFVLAGKIAKIKITKDNLYRVVVTAASRGYPGDYSSVIGKQIFGLDRFLRHPERSEGSIKVFGAGVKVSNGQYLASGGRLFYVMAKGENVAQARKIAYNALSLVSVQGNNLHYRTDIGFRDLERLHKL